MTQNDDKKETRFKNYGCLSPLLPLICLAVLIYQGVEWVVKIFSGLFKKSIDS